MHIVTRAIKYEKMSIIFAAKFSRHLSALNVCTLLWRTSRLLFRLLRFLFGWIDMSACGSVSFVIDKALVQWEACEGVSRCQRCQTAKSIIKWEIHNRILGEKKIILTPRPNIQLIFNYFIIFIIKIKNTDCQFIDFIGKIPYSIPSFKPFRSEFKKYFESVQMINN